MLKDLKIILLKKKIKTLESKCRVLRNILTGRSISEKFFCKITRMFNENNELCRIVGIKYYDIITDKIIEYFEKLTKKE